MYRPPLTSWWSGRDDQPDGTYLFQYIQCVNQEEDPLPLPGATEQRVAFLGFACDEGVRRNRGRVGAAEGPEALRSTLAGMAGRLPQALRLIDCGDVACEEGRLEAAQEELGVQVQRLVKHGFHPILLGGGHSMAYGHYLGLEKHLGDRKLGIINLDAHFDLRPYDRQPNSGSPFRQIADRRKTAGEAFSYLCIGIQEYANSRNLFETAADLQVQYIPGEEIYRGNLPALQEQIAAFISGQDAIYLTVCLDVFSAAFAPGVSAPGHVGISPHTALSLIDIIMHSGKVLSCDVAEMNPQYDIDNRTARMAAALIYRMISSMSR